MQARNHAVFTNVDSARLLNFDISVYLPPSKRRIIAFRQPQTKNIEITVIWIHCDFLLSTKLMFSWSDEAGKMSTFYGCQNLQKILMSTIYFIS